MTVDAAVLCCCGQDVECCPLTSVAMSFGTISIGFDFTFTDPFSGQLFRRFSTTNFANGEWVPGSFGLSSNLRTPIVLPRRSAGTSDPLFGTIGRCGFRESRFVPANTSFYGWVGNVATVPAGLPATAQNTVIWNGNARLSGQSTGSVSYYIRPFQLNGWNQAGGSWAFEAGIQCGGITVGVVQNWSASGCPVGTEWAPIDIAGGFTYYRGKVRTQTSIFGSMTNLTEPTYSEAQVLQIAASYPESSVFEVSIS